jgi:hypothetical protein
MKALQESRLATGAGIMACALGLCLASGALACDNWHRLGDQQLVRLLTSLRGSGLRPLAPAYLPPGFRVIHADAGMLSTARNNLSPSYALTYGGPHHQCVEVTSRLFSTDGLTLIETLKTKRGEAVIHQLSQSAATSDSPVKLVGVLRGPGAGQAVVLSPPAEESLGRPVDPTCSPIALADFRRVLHTLRPLP